MQLRQQLCLYVLKFVPLLHYFHGNNELKSDIQNYETIWRWRADSSGEGQRHFELILTSMMATKPHNYKPLTNANTL